MTETATPTYRPYTLGDHGGGVFTARLEEDLRNFKRMLEREGFVIGEDTRGNRPWNHRVIGFGVGHDDADFAETGRSMAAYYENGEAYGGERWWHTGAFSKRYYTGEGR